MDKHIRLEFDAISENEGLSRVVVAAFLTQIDPTLEEISDVKTAVSEAVTNSIIHGYESKGGRIVLEAKLEYISENKKVLTVTIEDKGIGIDDVAKARMPLFTTKPDSERSGMGFAFMEAFMDEVVVKSTKGCGTTVIMKKLFSAGE